MSHTLYTTGPIQVPDFIQQEISKPVLYHRDAEFLALFYEVGEGLKFLLQTENDILNFTAAGTGGMEAIVCNLFSAGDRVCAIDQGKFSARWADICSCYGLSVERLQLPWGESVTPHHIETKLADSSPIKAFLLPHCETSTGALNDIQAIAAAIHKHSEALIIIDAIATVGVVPLKTDTWGIDVVLISSNKGLMNPPGLVFIAVNDRAWELSNRSNLPRYYFNFQMTHEALKSKKGALFTPAVSLFRGVHRALDEFRRRGLEKRWRDQQRLAQAFRMAMVAMELKIFPKHPSDSVTVIEMPSSLKASQISDLLKTKYQTIISKGQGELSDRVIRIGHFGEINIAQATELISALETVFMAFGWVKSPGVGIAAFNNIFFKN